MARSRRWQLARAASNCGAVATLSTFLGSVTLRGGLLGRIPSINELGGLSMTIDSVTPIEQTMAITDVLATNDVRTLVAKHLGVSVDRVTDEAHFTNDATRYVISLVGALRPESRLIFTFTLMTRPCPASGASQCGSNVRTAELNMRRRWSGLPRSHSPSNLLKRNAQGIRRPRACLRGQANGGCHPVLSLSV